VGDVVVRGLAGRTYTDKVRDGGEFKEEEPDVTLPTFTDRVYIAPVDAPEEKDVLIGTKSGEMTFAVTNAARINGAPEPVDIVVWNPYADASPGDLPPPSYEKFVCLEPGLVAAHKTLAPGAVAELSQKMVAQKSSARPGGGPGAPDSCPESNGETSWYQS
jgi:D-hexose-6-phosphate mutarotase